MNKTAMAIPLLWRALATLPWLGLPAFGESLLYLMCYWTVLALSWNILSGYSGYFSLDMAPFSGGHVHHYGCAGRQAQLAVHGHAPLAAVLPALLGLALGFVVFRVKSVRGRVVCAADAGRDLCGRHRDSGHTDRRGPAVPQLCGSTQSWAVRPRRRFVPDDDGRSTVLIAWRIQTSRLGWVCLPSMTTKTWPRSWACPIALQTGRVCRVLLCAGGPGGGIHALFVSYVTAGETFNITVPLTVVPMSVLGGTGIGPGRWWAPEPSRPDAYFFTAGDHAVAGAQPWAASWFQILFMPDGIMRRAGPGSNGWKRPAAGGNALTVMQEASAL